MMLFCIICEQFKLIGIHIFPTACGVDQLTSVSAHPVFHITCEKERNEKTTSELSSVVHISSSVCLYLWEFHHEKKKLYSIAMRAFCFTLQGKINVKREGAG